MKQFGVLLLTLGVVCGKVYAQKTPAVINVNLQQEHWAR
jgi:hypothetical protein